MSVARTRCGRISRPPRHVVRDYKRLNESNKDVDDENENNGGYSDYRNEDTNATSEIKNTESTIASTLYGTTSLTLHYSPSISTEVDY